MNRRKKFEQLFKGMWLSFNKSDLTAQNDPGAFDVLINNCYGLVTSVPDADMEKFFRRFNEGYESWPLPQKWRNEVNQYHSEKRVLTPEIKEYLHDKETNDRWGYINLQMTKYWQFMAYKNYKPQYPDAFNALGRYHIHLCQLFDFNPVPWFTKHVYNYNPDEKIAHDDTVIKEQFSIYIKKFGGKIEGWQKVSEIFINQ